jgi:hypothetical protein
MPALRKYRVFISHVWDYGADYYRIVEFLNEAPNLYWENLSVPKHNPVTSEELEKELRNQMRPADVFIILAGMYAAHSDWIDFELQFARRIGRPIIGVRPWGAERMPTAIQNAAIEIVGWNGGSVVSAIRRHALPSGS